jgi:hypothetical protein
MPLPGSITRFNWTADNWSATPSANVATQAVTPGGGGSTWGSWVNLLGALANDAYAINVRVLNGATSAANNSCVMELGIDPAGGSSYTAIIPAHPIGGPSSITQTGSGLSFLFPIFIPAGATVGARMKALAASPGARRVAVRVYGKPTHPENVPYGTYAEVVGTITNTQAPVFTPGNAADGSWVDLGATVKDLWWWQIAYQIANATITAEYTYIDIAHGDASNKHPIARLMHGGTTGETIGTPLEDNMAGLWECYCPVSAGTHIYIRGCCNNAPDTGYQGVAIGIGG